MAINSTELIGINIQLDLETTEFLTRFSIRFCVAFFLIVIIIVLLNPSLLYGSGWIFIRARLKG